MIEVIRTPDSQFSDLPGYSFAPNYLNTDGLRIHYVDEGPNEGEPVLLLHGEPTWSYLYRHMIPPIIDAKLRVIAPDLPGFGKSDKPLARSDYTYAKHVLWMRLFIEELDLQQITLVCQDWGALIGLRVAAENEQRFARILVANGGLPDGHQAMPKAFHDWLKFSQTTTNFDIGRVIQNGTTTVLSDTVLAAYYAPFPTDAYKAGARRFPALVPITPDDPASLANRGAWDCLGRWKKPFLTAFSDGDPITRGADRAFIRHVPGATGQSHTVIENAGHFLQEDKGPELASVLVNFVRNNPL